MKAMILAAGKGERMLPLTANTPKPLLLVNGKSLIQHQIERLASNGIKDIVINHAYLGGQIEEALGDGHQLGVNIEYSAEDEPLETAGGIIKALGLLGTEAFVVVNADIWTDYSFKGLPSLDKSKCLAHLVMVDNAPHHPEGDFKLDNNSQLLKSSTQPGQALTYSGIGVFHPDFFVNQKLAKVALRPLLDAALDKSLLSGEYFQGTWVDVGTPQRLESLQDS